MTNSWGDIEEKKLNLMLPGESCQGISLYLGFVYTCSLSLFTPCVSFTEYNVEDFTFASSLLGPIECEQLCTLHNQPCSESSGLI